MKTKKKVIRLTESDLHNMIAEAVKTALNEIGDTTKGAYDLGRVYGRCKSQKNIPRRKELENYLDTLSFDDIPRRRAFDRGHVDQFFASDTVNYPEDRVRAYNRIKKNRENTDSLESSFGGREFKDNWKPR